MSGPSNVSQFKKHASAGALVELPSGLSARIRNPGMHVFLRKGMIPDSLTPIIQNAMTSGEIQKDPSDYVNVENIDDMLSLFDDVVIECWIAPQVNPVPDGLERSEDVLYVDEISFEDKSFTFQFAVGGVKDLESFRRQQNQMLESLSASSNVESSAK